MKAFILFFCTTAFSFSSSKVFTQNVNIVVDKDKVVTIDEVFDLLREQTDFTFIYQEDTFKDVPKIKLKKGIISANKLLNENLAHGGFNFELTGKNKIVITKVKAEVKAQQQIKISGVVKNAEGLPIPGVNIVVKGTTNGVQTDFDGKYSIQAVSNDILVYSYLGYETIEIPVNGKSVIEVVMKENISSLNEVVLIGYGSDKKSDLTGSVAVINANEAKKVSNSDVGQLLQGRAAGVTVTNDGQPGAAPNIRIRGIATFGDNQPLYIVDGVPVGTSIRDFNPNDIESIQILKDASAGAIYGSRAANGVVIIKTKGGRKNTPMKITYSSYFGIDEVNKRMPVLAREDYQMITNEKRTNAGLGLIPGNDSSSGLFISDVDTDWQKIGLKNGSRQNHSFNFTGGGEEVTYNASLDYFKNEGVFVGNGPNYERYSGRINTTIEKGRFKVSPSFFYAHSYENSLTFRDDVLTGGRPPLINDLVWALPTMSLYDENNKGGYGGTDSNIHQAIALNVPGINSLFTNWIKVDRMFMIINPQYSFIKDDKNELTYKLNLSYDKTFTRDFSFVPAFQMGYFFGSGKSLLDHNSRSFTVGLVENTLNYTRTTENYTIDLLAGQTFQRNQFYDIRGHSESLPEPYYPVLDNGTNKNAAGGESESTIASYFGRVKGVLYDKYLFNVTVRRDGSSRFAASSRYGTFPSAALGWKISNEDFFPISKDIVSELKFRGSWGQLGNQNIGNYLFQPVINSNMNYNFDGTKVIGGLQTSVYPENIKWETTTSTNFAVDAKLFNSLDLTVEYYNKKTTDILVGVPIAHSTGSINVRPTVNAGSIENKGFDVELSYQHKTEKDFSYNISANISTVQNKVLALGGNNEPIYGVGSKTEVGHAIGQHFGFVYEGIFQTQDEISSHAFQNAGTNPGDIKFKDLNGDNVVNAEDRQYLGSALPKFTYGLNFTANYKKIDFTLFASGAGGYLINSRVYRTLMWSSDYLNAHTDILDRWTPTNTDTNIPRMIQNDPNGNQRDSDRPGWLQKGDYLRLNTISLGYTLPEFEKLINSARVYFTVQNVHTFTAYKGYNPDFNSGTLEPGFDNGTYPRPRTFMLGVDVSF